MSPVMRVDVGYRWAVAAGQRDDVVDQARPHIRGIPRVVPLHLRVGRRQRHAARRQVVVDEAGAGAAQIRAEIGSARVRAVAGRAIAKVDLLDARRTRPRARGVARLAADGAICPIQTIDTMPAATEHTSNDRISCTPRTPNPLLSEPFGPCFLPGHCCDVGGARVATDAPAVPKRASVNHARGRLPMAPGPSAAY